MLDGRKVFLRSVKFLRKCSIEKFILDARTYNKSRNEFFYIEFVRHRRETFGQLGRNVIDECVFAQLLSLALSELKL